MEYECEIEFTRDCTWAEDSAIHTQGSFWTNGSIGIPVKKGRQEKVAGKIMFEKAENGWRAK